MTINKTLVFIFLIALQTTAATDVCNSYFIRKDIAAFPPVRRISFLKVLQSQIAKFFAASTLQRRAIVVDLDDTIFLSQRRVVRMMHEFDEHHGTTYFAKLQLSDLDIHDFRESIIQWIKKTVTNDLTLQEKIIADIRNYTGDNYMKPSLLKHDDVNSDLILELQKWAQQGVEIIYITGRGPEELYDSQMYLGLAGAPEGPLFIRPRRDIETGGFKKMIVQNFRLQGVDILAMIDDQKANLIAVSDILPIERRFLLRYNHEYIYYSFFPLR